jgi:hypothetical protein
VPGTEAVSRLCDMTKANWELALEHFPAKWMPVRVEKMRPNKMLEHSAFRYTHSLHF